MRPFAAAAAVAEVATALAARVDAVSADAESSLSVRQQGLE